MEKKNNKIKSDEKGLWAILKESMDKTSSGCGPGCGCHVENQDNENQPKDASNYLEKDKEQA